MIKKKGIVIFFLTTLITNANASFYSYESYEKYVKKLTKEEYVKSLKKKIKNFGMDIDKDDYEKIKNETKKAIEKKILKKLKIAKKQFNKYGEILKDPKELSRELSKEIKNEISKKFNKVIDDAIKNQLQTSLSLGGGYCCCIRIIKSNIGSISKFFLPKIKKEAVNLGKTAKMLKEIKMKLYVNRTKDGEWQTGELGRNTASLLTEDYYLIKNKNVLKKIDVNNFLQIKADNNIKKTIITENKLKLLQIKEDLSKEIEEITNKIQKEEKNGRIN